MTSQARRLYHAYDLIYLPGGYVSCGMKWPQPILVVEKLIVSATPGRIVLEMEANASGRIIKRGKLKLWTGDVPATPIEEAVNQSRHYTR